MGKNEAALGSPQDGDSTPPIPYLPLRHLIVPLGFFTLDSSHPSSLTSHQLGVIYFNIFVLL
jgi:hypothetical protein